MLRGVLVTTALVVLYYLLPLDRPLDTGTAVRLLIGLLVFVGLTVWQVRAIAGARYPGLRAAERWDSSFPSTCCCSPRHIS